MPPWQRERPPGPRRALTADQRRRARARAERDGRRYANLVDNLAILAEDARAGRRSS